MRTMLYSHNNDSEARSNSNASFFRPVIQAKLSVNEPGDHYEREADAMADKVMRMTDRSANTPTFFKPADGALQRKCQACEEEDKHVHRKENNSDVTAGNHELDGYVSSLSSSGQSMSAPSRQFFEPKFGHDFSNVKIHTDSVAAKSAQSINALAYTSGNNIVFNSGQYSPDSDSGKRLIAHELTHVVQQGAAQTKSIQRDEKKDPPKPCPATFTISDDIYKAIADAWSKSGHGGDTVQEQGGKTVTDKTGKSAIRPGSGTGGNITYPAEQAGDTTTGTFHTHPYSKSEGSYLGMSFSGADITNFISGVQGSVKYVGAGSCIFLLNTIDAAARNKCKTEDTTKRWNDAFAKAGGTPQQKVEVAVKAAIANCGLCYYRACRANDSSPIPKDAQLA
ncbi:DUF4157 domain-containing protein [Mucilaginibacter sp. X4EP1]|uniref:eCIS core domain-containing protein n=1 Tax=Mucilaginibacter sp. X4EP1 TaxID=2723092 RepID=UPI0021695A94|nr:DUF4157 domain-containing protein [Mucilaginibacter sp. X4EP1]MCS3816019.1 hypothetical protein [Mucilaginibacter sp. X4EP1]